MELEQRAAMVVYWWDVAMSEGLSHRELAYSVGPAIEDLREAIGYKGEPGNA